MDSEPEINELPTAQPVAKNGSECPEFVRVLCPYPLVAVGLAHALEGGGLHHGPKPPAEGVPHCVVLWADDAEGLPEAVGRLREESLDAPILVLGMREDLPLAYAALKAGARGFLHAGMQPAQIARALCVAFKGEVVSPRRLLELLLAELLAEGDTSAVLGDLSARQWEILELVGEGFTNAQVAKRVFLSESTVKQHLRAVYKLLGVRNRTEAARLLVRRGDPPEPNSL